MTGTIPHFSLCTPNRYRHVHVEPAHRSPKFPRTARAELATLRLTVRTDVAAPLRLEIIGLGDVVFTPNRAPTCEHSSSAQSSTSAPVPCLPPSQPAPKVLVHEPAIDEISECGLPICILHLRVRCRTPGNTGDRTLPSGNHSSLLGVSPSKNNITAPL